MKILITGASGYFGGLLTSKLSNEIPMADIVGLDIRDPEESKKMTFLSGDTRKKRIEDVFKTQGKIDAVIHLARDSRSNVDSQTLMMTNVYSVYHMLELCQKYEVGAFIYPSSSLVYGARNDNPALIRESHPLLGNRDFPAIRDRVEADMICQTFSHGNAAPRVIILRFVPIWRKTGEGMLTKYMSRDLVPTMMGFDPMFQMIYEEEVLDAFSKSVTNLQARGAYNVAGHIYMPLSRVIRRLGKKPVPVPDFLIHDKGKYRWSKELTFDFNYLKYPFVVDDARIRKELGYQPIETHKIS